MARRAGQSSMPQQQAPLDTHDQCCDRPRYGHSLLQTGSSWPRLLADPPYWCSSGGDILSCCRSGKYLRPLYPSSCSPSPHSHLFSLIPQLANTIMSDTSVKLKTPQTGEYDQPTGL